MPSTFARESQLTCARTTLHLMAIIIFSIPSTRYAQLCGHDALVTNSASAEHSRTRRRISKDQARSEETLLSDLHTARVACLQSHECGRRQELMKAYSGSQLKTLQSESCVKTVSALNCSSYANNKAGAVPSVLRLSAFCAACWSVGFGCSHLQVTRHTQERCSTEPH